jgi:hypothetical protein
MILFLPRKALLNQAEKDPHGFHQPKGSEHPDMRRRLRKSGLTSDHKALTHNS